MLFYGSEIWVVTGEMLKVLEGLHNREVRWITGMTATHGEGGDWEYPPVVTAMECAGIHPIREYIRRWQATFSTMVACLLLMYSLMGWIPAHSISVTTGG